MDNKIQCQNCGEWIDGEAKFCPNCGAFSKRSFRQDPNKQYCVFCGSEVAAGDNFCPVCGTKIEAVSTDSKVASEAGRRRTDSEAAASVGAAAGSGQADGRVPEADTAPKENRHKVSSRLAGFFGLGDDDDYDEDYDDEDDDDDDGSILFVCCYRICNLHRYQVP